jgi:hypothetical protein
MCNTLQKVTFQDVLHVIVAETDRNLMTPVCAGSLLADWSGLMPSQEAESEYDGFLLFLRRVFMFLPKYIYCVPSNALFGRHTHSGAVC